MISHPSVTKVLCTNFCMLLLEHVQGYRDAHCLFLDAPVDGRASYADTNKPHPLSQRWKEFSLCLAIHAPRRGVVEVQILSLDLMIYL